MNIRQIFDQTGVDLYGRWLGTIMVLAILIAIVSASWALTDFDSGRGAVSVGLRAGQSVESLAALLLADWMCSRKRAQLPAPALAIAVIFGVGSFVNAGQNVSDAIAGLDGIRETGYLALALGYAIATYLAVLIYLRTTARRLY